MNLITYIVWSAVQCCKNPRGSAGENKLDCSTFAVLWTPVQNSATCEEGPECRLQDGTDSTRACLPGGARRAVQYSRQKETTWETLEEIEKWTVIRVNKRPSCESHLLSKSNADWHSKFWVLYIGKIITSQNCQDIFDCTVDLIPWGPKYRRAFFTLAVFNSHTVHSTWKSFLPLQFCDLLDCRMF